MGDILHRRIMRLGGEVLRSEGMQTEKNFRHHGEITVYQHSLRVARWSLLIADRCPFSINEEALIRGALLHDYYLYDWHDPDPGHRLHGFHHAKTACRNAIRDFRPTELELEIIRKHMFPLTLIPPARRESWIVCIADKIAAVQDYLPHKSRADHGAVYKGESR